MNISTFLLQYIAPSNFVHVKDTVIKAKKVRHFTPYFVLKYYFFYYKIPSNYSYSWKYIDQ